MKILQVIHGYPPTYNAGSEVYTRAICEELSKNHEVQVFTREEDVYRLDFATRTTFCNGIPLTLVNLPREKDGYDHPQVNRAFRQVLEQFHPDVVHLGHLNHLSLGIVKEAKEMSIPIVFTLHDFWMMCPRGQFLQRNFDGENLYSLCNGQEDRKCANQCYRMYHSCRPQDEAEDLYYWTGWINRRMNAVRSMVPLIDEFIAPSKYLMNRFVHDFGLPIKKVTYLDYGFPTEYLQPVVKTEQRPFTFGYIGTHIPAKGVNLLIQAFAAVKEPARLIIWGRPNGQNTVALQKMAAESSNPVLFRGEYENPHIASAVFQHTDAIIVPSIWGENSPLVIHEAQACRVPVITSDYGGMKEYVSHRVNGLLFKHRDWQDLTTQLQWALKNPAEMEVLGKRGYLYSPEGQVPNIEEHCRSLENIYLKAIAKHESNIRNLAHHH